MTLLIRYSFVFFGIGMLVFVAISHFRTVEPPANQVIINNDDIQQEERRSLQVKLRGVEDELATGLAAQWAIGNSSIIKIDAQLTQPPVDTVYYGWLIHQQPEFIALPLGKLKKASETVGWWRLDFETALPLLGYTEIWVTREPEYRVGDYPGPIIMLKGEWQPN